MMRGKNLTFEEQRIIWGALHALTPRSRGYIVACSQLAERIGRSYETVSVTYLHMRQGRPKWSPAVWAYVRGEIDRIEDWVDPAVKSDPEPEPIATNGKNVIAFYEMGGWMHIVPDRFVAMEARVIAINEKCDLILEKLRGWE